MTMHEAPFSRILEDLPRRRTLAIPPPTPRLEKAVDRAVKRLAKRYDRRLEKAEETIEKFGFTIEATRLRDRLARAATTDVQRLVLSTPGVPEALFMKAIKKELDDEQAGEYEAGVHELLFKAIEKELRDDKDGEHERAATEDHQDSADGAAADSDPPAPSASRSTARRRRTTTVRAGGAQPKGDPS